jgi:hypothetical protein
MHPQVHYHTDVAGFLAETRPLFIASAALLDSPAPNSKVMYRITRYVSITNFFAIRFWSLGLHVMHGIVPPLSVGPLTEEVSGPACLSHSDSLFLPSPIEPVP